MFQRKSLSMILSSVLMIALLGSIQPLSVVRAAFTLQTNYTSLAAGSYHTCAVRSDGTVACWGSNAFGASTPPSGLNNVIAVSIGGYQSCALKSDGTAVCWGQNDDGQATVPSSLSSVIAVEAGGYHTCALKIDSSVVCWGDNDYGQTNVPSGLSNVVAISAGVAHSCALKNDATVVCWGWNVFGQGSVPPGLTDVISIDSRANQNCVVKNDATAYCWGNNYYGETNIPAGLSGVSGISAGGNHTCALKNDGTVVCWGGALGNSAAIVPSGLNGVTAVSAGDDNTCALLSDGGIRCWGNNTWGQSISPNLQPSFTKGADITVQGNSGTYTQANWATAIKAGPASTESGQAVQFNASNNNNALFAVQPAVSADGILTFTPQTGASGTATITLTLQDNGGTANGGIDTSAAETFSVTVVPLPTNTPTNTNTPTATFTASNTPTATLTPTNTSTVTIMPSNTVTTTATPTATFTASNTPTATLTPTNTPTTTLTPSNTATSSPTNTVTPSRTATITATSTPTSTLVPRIDTIGVYKNGVFSLRNSNGMGATDITVAIGGDASDLPVAGDWNGDGIDTIGIYRGSTGVYFLSDSNTAPTVAYNLVFGNPGDTPFAGKWTVDMTHDGVGVYRNSNGILYQKKQLTTGFSDYFAVFGNPGDQGYGGDFDGDGFDSIGIYRSSNQTWYMTNDTQPSGITFSDINFTWDISAARPIIGDWDGDGDSTVGYLTTTGNFVLHPNNATAGTDNVFAFGPAGGKPVAGKWIAASRPSVSGIVGNGQPGSSSRNPDGGGNID